jgi:eukaryotic translation initiation factor 2-alpha kinase 4
MIQYPLLMPYNHHFDDYAKAFKLTDASGLVVSLPYNHRIPFARYLARSGCSNIKRYYIGKAFSEKLKLTSLHPREHVEASFDIVTSTHSDYLPEIEILSVVNSVISSFGELHDQSYKLIINNTYVLNAILIYCGVVTEEKQKKVFYLLSEYNNKLNKSQEVSEENRIKWFRDHLPLLDLNDVTIEKLVPFLLKSGDYEKMVSELKILIRSESNYSKSAKEGFYQLKLITTFYKLLGLKFPVVFSTSFVLPSIAHPFEYSGFMFQLIIKKKRNNDEYDILANGGRYDKLINFFRNKQLAPQYAVGVSFDFEKMVFLINEKSKQHIYRPELAICSIEDPLSSSNLVNVTGQTNLNNNASTSSINGKQVSLIISNKSDAIILPNNMNLDELKNRLRLFKQFETLNKFSNFGTNFLYEKFTVNETLHLYFKNYSCRTIISLR